MISRRTARTLAQAYADIFSHEYRGGTHYNPVYKQLVSGKGLYDYLYVRDHDAWFLAAIEDLNNSGKRDLMELIMGLHTGLSLRRFTLEWKNGDREKLGQRLLFRLAEDMLYLRESEEGRHWISNSDQKIVNLLIAQLELDGYSYRNGHLRQLESNVLDEQAEIGMIEDLWVVLELNNRDVAFKRLKDAELGYCEGRWSNCISDARAFMESSLQEVADKHHRATTGEALEERIYDKAIEVRFYLEKSGLFSHEEIMAVKEVYGLMSETGSHPYIARKDQARLTLNLALTIGQFALLKLQFACH
jgi:hypothetical protein